MPITDGYELIDPTPYAGTFRGNRAVNGGFWTSRFCLRVQLRLESAWDRVLQRAARMGLG